MIYRYLFKHMNCGHGESTYTYQPFTTKKPLTQDDAYTMMYMHNPLAGKMGSNIDDLYIVACDQGYEMIRYNARYHHPDHPRPKTDPLPESFYDWQVIESIMGNY